MSKRTYEELRDMLRHELDVLTKKGEVTKETLDYFQKLTSTLTKVETLMGMSGEEGNSMNGYSQRYSEYYHPWSMRGSYDGGVSNNYSMNQGMSNTSYDGGTSNTGMSNRGSYAQGGSSYDGRAGRDADSDGRYSEDNSSYRGGRYSGRRYSRDGYSRHTAKEKMIEKLETMMDSATNEKERNAIMNCIEELEGQ